VASIWRKSLGSFLHLSAICFFKNTIKTVKQWQNITPTIKSCMEKRKKFSANFFFKLKKKSNLKKERNEEPTTA
jgi:hypothetical protein